MSNKNYFDYLLSIKSKEYTQDASLVINYKNRIAYIKCRNAECQNMLDEDIKELKVDHDPNYFNTTIAAILIKLGLDRDGDVTLLDIFINTREICLNCDLNKNHFPKIKCKIIKKIIELFYKLSNKKKGVK